MNEFLYLNSPLCEQFLAQIENGLYDGESEREVKGREFKGEANVDVPFLKGGGGASDSRETEVSRTRRQTPESRFNRLEAAAKDSNDNSFSDISEHSSRLYGKLRSKQLVSADCYLDIPPIGQALSQIDEIKGFFDLMKTFAPESINKDDEASITGMSKLSKTMGGKLVCTGEVGDHNPKLVFKLGREHMRVDIPDLEGDVTVFGKVQRKWPEGENFPLISVPGLDMVNRRGRRSIIANCKNEDNDGMVIEGPGVTLSVVAIYR
ncbi:DUF6414 family protein [Nocardiopsis nanhaiensis]